MFHLFHEDKGRATVRHHTQQLDNMTGVEFPAKREHVSDSDRHHQIQVYSLHDLCLVQEALTVVRVVNVEWFEGLDGNREDLAVRGVVFAAVDDAVLAVADLVRLFQWGVHSLPVYFPFINNVAVRL